MDDKRMVPMLGGAAADIIIAPEQYTSIQRLTGSAAVAAGLPAIFNPRLTTGEYIAAIGETSETKDWQGTWIDAGATFLVHRMELKNGRTFPCLSLDTVGMAVETLKQRRDVKRYRVRRTGRMSAWGGDLEWAYAAAPIHPEGFPKGRAHVVAFNWLCGSKRVEVIGVHQVNIPGRHSILVEDLLREMIVDEVRGSA